ncbi:bis(5'-nucleosyl)-tetraphosphatase (symmetrical) YqeK [Alicyclobacillus tolerans]|uniref:bis(5'-nucleosyl)-tetraphosphatase (symmetrical) YqeK n=1 Tax=Alicyclobacillus tolerans TaxID=90970 RepID=UPI001F24760E|nr:bis(5'-nucleosyl)-tetraphosphatase (symmetrical) YqeK [Alicyclobacillus tolerans]MCF8563308.1 bis(5'-nucleosyl)-tetraphosphatase (symmetrical) YqeK [Alicyclobacillus tolerans]
MQESDIRERVRAEMSPERFSHTEGVVQVAGELAKKFGEDEHRARTAAWIHDIAREWPNEQQQQYAEKIEIPSGFALIPVLLHGPIAAHLAAEWFGISDQEIHNAIRYHTTGRIGMSNLEMIVCLADAIEPGRHYPGVDRIRELAEKDLVRALAESFDSTISYLLERHQPIFPLTVMARNDFWDQIQMSQSREETE